MRTGTIGSRLRLERERLGLTQDELAKAGGVGRQSQFRFESGQRSPDADYLAAVAKVGADVLFIVTGKRR